ncbi:MAG: hypothetical protein R2822_12645 [Spirosomataceae bacterium]
MNTFVFELDSNHNVIIVNAVLDGYSLKLLLDTGASHSVIDITTLIINGYSYSDSVAQVQIETAREELLRRKLLLFKT